MAYYTALIAKWGTLAPDTTANKIIAINAITVTGSVPATFFVAGADIMNCLDYTEFKGKTAAQQNMIMQALVVPGQIKGGAGTFVGAMFVDIFGVSGNTITALTALAKGVVQPWWQASVANNGGGLNGPVSASDLAAAGGLT